MSTDNQQALEAALDQALPATAAEGSEVAATETGAEQQAQALAEYEAPVFWDAQTKDAWKALHGYTDGRAHLEALHKQWGKTQAYLTKKEQEASQYQRRLQTEYEPLNQFLSPYVQQWARQGLDPIGGLRAVMSWRDALESDPQGTIVQLAQELGIDLAQATAETPWVDPHVQQLQSELQQLKQAEQQRQQYQMQSQQQFLMQQVEAFRQATDGNGNPMHPHFEAVFDDMLAIAAARPGITPDKAYATAVALNPELSAQAQQQAAAAAEAQARAAANAQKSQVAQTVAKSGVAKAAPARGSATASMSIDDAVAAAFTQ